MTYQLPANANGLTAASYWLARATQALSIIGIVFPWLLVVVASLSSGPVFALACFAVFTTVVFVLIRSVAASHIERIVRDHT